MNKLVILFLNFKHFYAKLIKKNNFFVCFYNKSFRKKSKKQKPKNMKDKRKPLATTYRAKNYFTLTEPNFSMIGYLSPELNFHTR